ncbi:MAG: glutathione peroxidase [Eubacteriales bacterium]|nr:glutathione peroxidase [Eubacteriales bacterium]
MTFYDYTVKDRAGEDVALSTYKGKVLLVVNTATGCGFTPQYEGLQKLYDAHKEKGFEILDFPCNQFANQAPGTIDEIQSFCTLNYGTTFPRFAKIDVNGTSASDLYNFLKKAKRSALGSSIKWNFTKFLIDRDGKVVKCFAPTDTPESIEKDILALL